MSLLPVAISPMCKVAMATLMVGCMHVQSTMDEGRSILP